MTEKLISAAIMAVWILNAPPVAAANECVMPPSGSLQSGQVASVPDGQSLILSDGRHLRLDGLNLPATPQGQPLAAATAALQSLALDATISFFATAKDVDRYGRLPVIASSGRDVSLQRELLAAGWARISRIPHPPCRNPWFAAESAARAAGTGLWALPQFAVRRASDTLTIPVGSFQLVEGRVMDSQVRRDRLYLNFGSNWRTDFTVTVAPKHRKKFPGPYTGCLLRMRGWVINYNGPQIEMQNPENLEKLSCPP